MKERQKKDRYINNDRNKIQIDSSKHIGKAHAKF